LKEWQKAVLGVVVAVVVIFSFFAAIFGSIDPRQWVATDGGGGDGGGDDGYTIVNPTQLAILGLGRDTLDSTASLTDASNFDISYWSKRGESYMRLGAGSSGTCTIEIQAAETIYIVAEPKSGQAYYIDKDETVANNPRMSVASYFDIDNDGYKEFVFPFSTANIEKPIGSTATIYVYPYFLAYTAPSDTAPSDITGIGAATATKYIEWYLTFGATKKAFAVVKVEFVLNTTDSTKVTLVNMNIPGLGYVTGDNFELQRGSSSLTYVWDVTPYNLDGAVYLKYGTNQLNKFEFTTRVECNLADDDNVSATCNIYGLNQTGTAAPVITDTMVLTHD
jgi:hypothetical protein